jgi:Ser/Thr protein kinase RdoA (MazF antagonist)
MKPSVSLQSAHLDSAARSVARLFPAVKLNGEIQFLHNCGGFSGACLWRVEAVNGWLCLRAWPSRLSLEDYLPIVHRLMEKARAAGLAFVPAVERPTTGQTVVCQADRFWDVTQWMPGRADFRGNPHPLRLASACSALARLHQTWQAPLASAAPCPAIRRRIQKCHEWSELVATGWRPTCLQEPEDFYSGTTKRAWTLLEVCTHKLPAMLAPWDDRKVPMQPCHCDLWHDHVQFEQDEVVALLDYGSVKTDHVAVDLARLLGSMAGDDQDLWSAGLAGYRSVRSLSAEEETLVHVLDRTGTVLALANWLKWIYHDARTFPDRQAVAHRIAGLVNRVESWS